METENIKELRKRINEIRSRDPDKAFAMGWNKAIDEVLSIVSDMFEDNSRRYKVGDKIEVNLEGFGIFTATAQKVCESDVTFMFDECVTTMPMNSSDTNKGGYKASSLCYWLNTTLKSAFPDELKERLIDISIPTCGQMFGHDNRIYNRSYEPDNDEQFELMKIRKNRISDFNNNSVWYWLQNATKEEVSSAYFAFVSNIGRALCNGASYSHGVRPVFILSV